MTVVSGSFRIAPVVFDGPEVRIPAKQAERYSGVKKTIQFDYGRSGDRSCRENIAEWEW